MAISKKCQSNKLSEHYNEKERRARKIPPVPSFPLFEIQLTHEPWLFLRCMVLIIGQRMYMDRYHLRLYSYSPETTYARLAGNMCDSQASFAPAIGPSWSGLSGLRHIVIFGDSYSAVGYKGSLSPHPTVNEPLGEPFPGFCYTEAKRSGKFGSTLPNWVGHFISSRKSKEQTLLVYDYAVGGHTVSGVRGQVERQFLPHVGQKPEWARWNAEDTLFVTWVGINDCAINWANREGAIDELVGLQELLYTQAGARNFLLVDVPPIHLSPAVPEPQPSAGKHYLEWNAALRSRAKNFQSAHPDCTTLIFSAHETFTRLCTDPEAFGFQKTDVKQPSGAMWVDYLHPTSAVHKVVANDIEIFLEGLTPAEGGNKVDELVRK